MAEAIKLSLDGVKAQFETNFFGVVRAAGNPQWTSA
jgi:hypothetical protein